MPAWLSSLRSHLSTARLPAAWRQSASHAWQTLRTTPGLPWSRRTVVIAAVVYTVAMLGAFQVIDIFRGYPWPPFALDVAVTLVLLLASALALRWPLQMLLVLGAVVAGGPMLTRFLYGDPDSVQWWHGSWSEPLSLLSVSVFATAVLVGRRCTARDAAAGAVAGTLVLSLERPVDQFLILLVWFAVAAGAVFRVVRAPAGAVLSTGWLTRVAPSPRSGSHRSLEAVIAVVSALVAVLGLLLFVPVYLSYESFYRQARVSPDEVGLGYATALSREIPWLVPASLIITAVSVALYGCTVTALAGQGHAAWWDRVGIVPAGPLRTAAAIAGALILLIAANVTAAQVDAVPDLSTGTPIDPEGRSFFKARAAVVEVTSMSDPQPPGLPRRMLLLGASDGATVFWDSARRRAVKLPTDAISTTVLSNRVMTGNDVVNCTSDRPFARHPHLDLAGVSYAGSSIDDSCIAARLCDQIIAKFLSGGWADASDATAVIADGTDSQVFVFRLPDYALLNAELLRHGAIPATTTWYPTPAISTEMTAAYKAAPHGLNRGPCAPLAGH